jgi:hypothetical protein
VVGFVGLLKRVTASNYGAITNSHNLQFTTAGIKSLSLLCFRQSFVGNGS